MQTIKQRLDLPHEFRSRPAFSTLGCGNLDLPGVMEIAGRYAIPCVEVRTLCERVDLPAYLTSHYQTPRHFASATNVMPARIISLGTSLRLAENTAACREAFLAYVPWAEACGASTLRVFDGGKAADRAEIDHAISTIQWWRRLRAEHGWNVDVAIETHDAFAVEPNLCALLEALPDCKLLWDSHHTWRKGKADPVRTWQLLRDRVQHIHVKDSVTDTHTTSGYRYVLPGEGEFPMSELLDVLREDGYRGILSLEWERHWHPELPPLTCALQAARQKGWWPSQAST